MWQNYFGQYRFSMAFVEHPQQLPGRKKLSEHFENFEIQTLNVNFECNRSERDDRGESAKGTNLESDLFHSPFWFPSDSFLIRIRGDLLIAFWFFSDYAPANLKALNGAILIQFPLGVARLFTDLVTKHTHTTRTIRPLCATRRVACEGGRVAEGAPLKALLWLDTK